MNKDELRKAVLAIPFGESASFDLDWIPVDGELGQLVFDLNNSGKGGSYTMARTEHTRVDFIFHRKAS